MGITFDKLGQLTGISKQYLSNLLSPTNEKKLSNEKLKIISIIFSLKRELLEDLLKQETPSSYIKENMASLMRDIDLKIFKQLMFAGMNISEFNEKYIEIGDVIDDQNALSKFLNEYDITDKTLLEDIDHSYQIWTLSNVLGETISNQSAYTIAFNILNYKMKYVNFLPLHADLQFEGSLNAISANVDKIITDLSSEKRTYWQKNDWKQYLHYFGIADMVFISNIRIFDAFSNNSRGSLNIGGKDTKSLKFVEIPSNELYNVRENLQNIILADQIGKFKKGENTLIEAIGCYANKKFPYDVTSK
ncbi:MAG: hypothetical protein HQK53_15205 [Oligoflexia bacterium]|nr:hypothetical protein [Oligoflexia bacterium]